MGITEALAVIRRISWRDSRGTPRLSTINGLVWQVVVIDEEGDVDTSWPTVAASSPEAACSGWLDAVHEGGHASPGEGDRGPRLLAELVEALGPGPVVFSAGELGDRAEVG